MNSPRTPAGTPAFPQPGVTSQLEAAARLAQRGDHEGALQELAQLERTVPESGLLWLRKAASLRALGHEPEALEAYRTAVRRNDMLIEGWKGLIEMCRRSAQSAEAEYAVACLARITTLPAQVAAGCSLLNEGDLDAAEELLRDYLVRHGPHVHAMRFLAQLGIKRKVLDDAELLLAHVLEMSPDYHEARYEFLQVLSERRKYLPALEQAALLLRAQPTNFEYRVAFARSLDGLGRHAEAVEVYSELLRLAPERSDLQIALAHALQVKGDREAAIALFKQAASSPAGLAPACFALGNLKTYRFSDDEIARLRARERAPGIDSSEHYQLCFALAKALEDQKEFAESFELYARGNALKRSGINYEPAVIERQVQARVQVWTPEFFAARQGVGCQSPDPIFVVGLARSGSTLIEQILASHSRLDGTLELPTLPHLVNQFRDRERTQSLLPSYPAVLAQLAPGDFERMGEIYLEETRPYRQRAPFFVDKMLANFREIGFIHLILPNAKIIDARREAMACCFGNFKQLFVNGQEYSYSLEEIGHYYRQYTALMDHWDRVLPGKVLRVRHEDVVNDLEGSVRRMLEFCGLPFEPACLEFHKTERSVRTVSSEQVRRPIYREGLAQWRNYEPWLGPLKASLGLLDE